MTTLLRLCHRLVLAAALGSIAAPAWPGIDLVGHDTDLFTTNPNIPSQVPNVLIVLDSTANWSRASQLWAPLTATNAPDCWAAGIQGSQQGDAEVCALYKAIQNLDEQVNVALMMFNDQDKGAYVRFPMSPMNAGNKTTLKNILAGIRTNNPAEKSPANAHYDFPMSDAFRYFNSFATYGGTDATPTDSGFADNLSGASTAYTSSARTVFKFLAGAKDSSCGYDYIIFIGNGFPNGGSVTPSIDNAAALLGDAGVTVDKTVLNATGANADIWARFLYQYGVKVGTGLYRHITTYTIDVCKAQCDSDQETLMKSMATVSQGKYTKATDLAAIETALKNVFAEVQAVNSVFAATTLPVSINVRGTNLNQVYIGVFRPDPTLSPRWLGNLKQYQLGIVNVATGQLGLVDDVSATAVNLNTGFISNTATSIWTVKDGSATDVSNAILTDGFWAFRTTYPQTDVGKDEDKPDGDLVEKGGVAQKIRQVYDFPDSTAAKTRNIYTCTGTCTSSSALCSTFTGDRCTSGYLFNSANADITAQKLGTFASTLVDSVTGSGTTATATIGGGHSFVAGNSVVISGASPDYYNGTFSVLASPAPTGTQFSYTVTPNPNATVDTTHAYVTFSTGNNTLNTSTDKITVTATPTDYDVASAAITAVVGNANQLSYTLSGSPGYPTTAASIYAVTGVRRVASVVSPTTTSNMIWDSSGKVTVTLPNHGYSTFNLVTITGATRGTTGLADPAFNVPGGAATGMITKVDDNSFTYLANGTPLDTPSVTSADATTSDPNTGSAPLFSWASNQLVIVCKDGITHVVDGTTGAITTTCDTASSFNSVTTGVVVSAPADTSITYVTSGGVSGVSSTLVAKVINTSTDINSWTHSSPTVAGSGASKTITLTLSSPAHTVLSQIQHPLAIGDSITVTGLTCKKSNGTAIDCKTGATSGIASSYTFALTATNGTTSAAFGSIDNLVSTALVGTTPTVTWTPTTTTPTFSKAVSITTASAGASTVQASGTIYSAKTGDLTGKVTSIASQIRATGTITAALSTSADPNERANLINWVRGQDNRNNENNTTTTPTDVRASVHGDVLHSRPAVVNYNRSSGDNDVFIFYGTNDGMVRAVKGGSTATGGGKEQWAFVPPEFFGKLKRLREQSPSIGAFTPRDYFFDGPIAIYTRDANKDGKIDTTVAGGANDKVYLFIGMRRGGRMYYALDVTDPLNPKLLWKKGCREATGDGSGVGNGDCDSRFGEIGQTWSEPKLGYISKWPTTLALMFAAGNDDAVEIPQPCFVTAWGKDSVTYLANATVPTPMNTTTCPGSSGTATTKTRSMGRGVFILNAVTGDVLWRATPRDSNSLRKKVAEMNYAMPGDLAVLRNRSNTGARDDDFGTESVPTGYMDRIYAADTGGNVWRVDVASPTTIQSPDGYVDFPVTRLASIAEAPAVGTHAALNYRKFLFSPDVVYASGYDAVLLGSGDREHPFDQVVKNRFYMFKDKNIGSIALADVNETSADMTVRWAAPTTGIISDTTVSTGLFDVTSNCLQDATTCSPTYASQAAASTALAAAKGWKLLYDANAGEKTIATATTAAGTVIFNTNQPKQDTVTGTTGSCTSDLGTARQYGISYLDGTATYIFGSLPAQYVPAGGRYAVFAGGGFLPQPVPVVVQIGGKYYQTVIAGVQTTNPGGLKLQSRVRTYWFRKVD